MTNKLTTETSAYVFVHHSDEVLASMTKDERALLLFFESAAVEHGGLIDSRRMNSDDHDIAKKWNDYGFVSFGRVRNSDIVGYNSMWCELSDDAWLTASAERWARCKRILSKRKWQRASEKNVD